MTTYNTGNPIGSTDARDLYDNAQNLDNFANGTAATYTDRLGVQRRSLSGIDAAADNVLNSIGYAVPVAYAPGISLTLTSQTVDYNGVIYAPLSSALPFITSSWGTDSSKFRAIQVTDADLITYTPAGTGAVATTVQEALHVLNGKTLTQIKNLSLGAGTVVETSGYATAGDVGAARYTVKTSAQFGGTPDGYGDHALPNGNVLVLTPANNYYHSGMYGVVDNSGNVDYGVHINALFSAIGSRRIKNATIKVAGAVKTTVPLLLESTVSAFYGPNVVDFDLNVVSTTAMNTLLTVSKFYTDMFTGKLVLRCCENATTYAGRVILNGLRLRGMSGSTWAVNSRIGGARDWGVVLQNDAPAFGNYMLEMDSFTVSSCGSSGSTTAAYNLSSTFTYVGEFGNSTRISVGTLPPADFTSGTMDQAEAGRWGYIMINDATSPYGGVRLYPIKTIDRTNGTIDLCPFLASSLRSAGTFTYVIGGGFYSYGQESAQYRVRRLATTYCAFSHLRTSNTTYSGAFGKLEVQYCTIGAAGTSERIEELYCEATLAHVAIARFGVNNGPVDVATYKALAASRILIQGFQYVVDGVVDTNNMSLPVNLGPKQQHLARDNQWLDSTNTTWLAGHNYVICKPGGNNYFRLSDKARWTNENKLTGVLFMTFDLINTSTIGNMNVFFDGSVSEYTMNGAAVNNVMISVPANSTMRVAAFFDILNNNMIVKQIT